MPEAAKQPQNISEPPPCLTEGQCSVLLKASFHFLKTCRTMMCFTKKKKNSVLVLFVHCTFSQKDFDFLRYVLQTRILMFVSVSAVESFWVSYNSIPFHSDSDGYVPAGQLQFVWKLTEVLYQLFDQSFVAIFHQCF